MTKEKIRKVQDYNLKLKKETNQLVVDRMIAQLEAGVDVWGRNWGGAHGGMPYNFAEKYQFSGMNVYMLMMFGGGAFATKAQVSKFYNKDGKYYAPTEGSQGIHIQKPYKKRWKNKDGSPKLDKDGRPDGVVTGVGWFKVFKLEQFVNYNTGKSLAEEQNLGVKKTVTSNHNRYKGTLDELLTTSYINNEKINIGIGDPAYSPVEDKISMPTYDDWNGTDSEKIASMGSTLKHECYHSTAPRLGRKLSHIRTKYALEELSAELCASFLNAQTGIDSKELEERSASYLQGWADKLKGETVDNIMKCVGDAVSGQGYILKASDFVQDKDTKEWYYPEEERKVA